MAEFEEAWRWHVAAGPPVFVGRSEELQLLGSRLIDLGLKLTAIQGRGVVGKSELAREFGRRNRQHFPGGLLWLTPSSDLEQLEPYVDIEFVSSADGRRLVVVEDDSRMAEDRLTRAVEAIMADATATVIIAGRRALAMASDPILIGPLGYDDVVRVWHGYNVTLPASESRRLFVQIGADLRMFILAGILIRDGRTSVSQVLDYMASQFSETGSAGESVISNRVGAWLQVFGPSLIATAVSYSREGTIEEYRDRLNLAQLFLAVAAVHASGKSSAPTANVFYAALLYTRFLVGFYSLVRLAPGNRITNDERMWWDWPTIATHSRALIETYYAYYYVALDTCDATEAKARALLMALHERHELLEMAREAGAEALEIDRLTEAKQAAARALASDLWFGQLSQTRQQALLNGARPFFESRSAIEHRASAFGPKLRWVYRFLSNYVHSTRLSFARISDERGRGDENDAERYYLILVLQLMTRCGCKMTLELEKVFPDALGSKNSHPRDLIRQILEISEG